LANSTTARLFVFLSVFVVGLFLWFRLGTPIAIDTAFMIDTTFLAHLGWRGVNGLSPIVDFWHFYGGFTAANLTLSFKLFGVSMKSVDFAFVLIFLQAMGLLLLLCYKRLSFASISLLFVLSATVILGPLSIEDGYRPYINHSFVYNHFAMIVIIAVSVFSMNPRTDVVSLDFLTSILAGIALFLLALAKPTFIVVAPFIVASCLMRGGCRAAVLVFLGFLVAFFLLDPWAIRLRGSFEEILLMGQIERAGGLFGRLRHAFLTVVAHAGYLTVFGFFAWIYGKGKWRQSASMFASMLLCAGGYGAATLSMNGEPDLMMLPMIIALLLLLTDRLKEEDNRRANLGYLCAVAMAAVLVLPATYYSGMALLRMDEAKMSRLITTGPLADYVVLNPDAPSVVPPNSSATVRLEAAVEDVAIRLDAGGPGRATDAYVILADGFHLLERIPKVASYGIITRGSTFDFTVPLESKPVPSFPVWPLARSTSFLDMSQVDIVMAVKNYDAPDHLSVEAVAIVAEEFHPCMESTFFVLSIRRLNSDVTCD